MPEFKPHCPLPWLHSRFKTCRNLEFNLSSTARTLPCSFWVGSFWVGSFWVGSFWLAVEALWNRVVLEISLYSLSQLVLAQMRRSASALCSLLFGDPTAGYGASEVSLNVVKCAKKSK